MTLPHLFNRTTLLWALAGAGWGLGAARLAFDVWPGAWSIGWGAVLGVGGGAALWAALAVWRRWPPWAALPVLLPLAVLLWPDTLVGRGLAVLAGGAALAVVWAERAHIQSPGWVYVGVAAILALTYVRTLAPAVGTADPFEYQVGAARLGVAHGNGYPLLMLLGHVATWVPVGTLAARVNALSAVLAVGAALAALHLARLLGARLSVAALAALAYGFSLSLWVRAVEIEAHTLNAALGLGLLIGAMRVLHTPTWGGLRWLAFGFGLALTNHLTTLMLAPALALAGLGALMRLHTGWAHTVRQQGVMAACTLAGLSVYLYLFWRWPAVSGGEVLTVNQFLYIITGADVPGHFRPLLFLDDWTRWPLVAGKLAGEYGPLAFVMVLAGWVALAGYRLPHAVPVHPMLRGVAGWWPLAVLALAYLGHTYFVLAYDPPEPDYSDFFLTLHGLGAVLLALGVSALVNRWPRWHAPALTALLMLPLGLFWANFPKADLSAQTGGEAWGRFALAYPYAPNALLLADPTRFAPLFYLTEVENVRPDLQPEIMPDEATFRARLDDWLAAGGTAYLGRYLPGLYAAYSLRSVGPLAEVRAAPFTQPYTEPAVRLAAPLTDTLILLGVTVTACPHAPLCVEAFWQVEATPARNLAVVWQLRDAAGVVRWQSAGQLPVNGLYPTNAWRPGETVSDFHALRLPAHLPPGVYELWVGAFPPFQTAADGWVRVMPVAVTPSLPPIAHAARAQVGAHWLVGYDVPATAAPGGPLTVTLWWQRGPARTVTVFGETHDLSAWPVGGVALTRHTLTAPNAARWLVQVEATTCGWLTAPAPPCPLAEVALTDPPLAQGTARYNDDIALLGVEVLTPQVNPGGLVQVLVRWQAVRRMTTSYTAFVHVVGPDGRLVAQRDYWPLNGSRLTTTWQPGEVLADPSDIWLPPDAPPGPYTLHIGWYAAETQQRLPVLAADGTPLDDKVVVEGLTVGGAP